MYIILAIYNKNLKNFWYLNMSAWPPLCISFFNHCTCFKAFFEGSPPNLASNLKLI